EPNTLDFNDNTPTYSGGASHHDLPNQQEPLIQPEVPPVPQLRRSNQVPIPTARADPENAPLSRVQKAVQDSIAARERLRAQRGSNEVPEPEPEADEQGTNEDPDIPNLANVASIEDIEYLLNSTLELKDSPPTPDIQNEPRTWAEAKLSGDADR
ncbi:hypothetical protein C0993_001030, partial [Termitomyces sp. T159_Od127]